MDHVFYLLRHLVVFLLIKIPVALMGIPIVAVALLFYIKDKRIAHDGLMKQRLPFFLKWWDNGDYIDRKYGLNGDVAHQSRHLIGPPEENDYPPNVRLLYQVINALYDPEMEGKTPPWYKIYWMRLNWLALRNPSNYFQHNVLGEYIKDLNYVKRFYNRTEGTAVNFVDIYDDTFLREVKEIGDWYRPGFRYIEASVKKDKIIREYYLMYAYPKWFKLFGKRRGLRIRIGYKLGHFPLRHSRPTIQWTFNFSPLSSYTGI